MATYKVLQDIEAEDKFVGPLTLKQFIFAAITIVACYISFLFITKHVWFLALPLLPIIFAGGFLAFPWGRDQPTEIWLLAKVRFLFKPRLRIWDQDGVEELVTITAPKRVEEVLTDNLSQTEVKSRLRALADTIDSRGWVVKNVNVNMFADPSYGATLANSDRLVSPSSLPQAVPAVDIRADEDILDATSNPVAQQLDQMITASTKEHREEMMEQIQAVRDRQTAQPSTPTQSGQNQPLWFMDEPASGQPLPAGYTTFSTQSAAPGNDLPNVVQQSNALSPEEQALLEKLHKEQKEEAKSKHSHLRVIEPLSSKKRRTKTPVKKAPPKPAATVPSNRDTSTSDKGPDPAILELAVNNDRNVASLAREANQKRKPEPPDEVVISLR